MSLAGGAAVAIWHDIAPEGRQEFYAWHGVEHMPERVGIPGFLRGRRYVAKTGDLEFFNLYETVSPQVLTGERYLERLNDPTPWTVATVTHFRRVSRSLCQVAASFGAGQGGLVSTWRYDVPPERAAAHLDVMKREILPSIAGRAGVAGAHLLVADADASAVENAEQKARAEANQVPRWIVLVEGWGDDDSFDALCREALPVSALTEAGATGDIAIGGYRLQLTVSETDVESASR